MRLRRPTTTRAALAVLASGTLLALAPSPALAGRYCGNMTVQAVNGLLLIDIDVTRAQTSCNRDRSVTAYAWSPKHRSHRDNKFLGDPPGWSCAVARATEPAVGRRCRRNRDGVTVTAFNRDYGE
jgi:hypothetical protein